MVEALAHRLHPVILSLGGSRKLWHDARLVPDDVVLYGNLPTKSFYSDGAMPVEEVKRRTCEADRQHEGLRSSPHSGFQSAMYSLYPDRTRQSNRR